MEGGDENNSESMGGRPSESTQPPTSGSGYSSGYNRSEIKLKSPTNEEDYIKSEKVHVYHGRPTHYYRDEPKHEILLTFQVK